MTMHKPILSLLVFAVLAACGGKSESEADKVIADYTAIKVKLCACTDAECATKLKEEADALERSAKDRLKKPTKEEKERFGKVETEVNDCARKFEGQP
jgi:hypothetical protein